MKQGNLLTQIRESFREDSKFKVFLLSILITLAICTYSLGEHIQLGMKSTLGLQYAKPGCGGVVLGLCNSAYAATIKVKKEKV